MGRVERSGDAGKPDTTPASQVLKGVRAEAQGDKVAVGDVLDGAGARVYGLALLLFALPEALPLPIVGLTAVVAIPLAIVLVWLIRRPWTSPAACSTETAHPFWRKHGFEISGPQGSRLGDPEAGRGVRAE